VMKREGVDGLREWGRWDSEGKENRNMQTRKCINADVQVECNSNRAAPCLKLLRFFACACVCIQLFYQRDKVRDFAIAFESYIHPYCIAVIHTFIYMHTAVVHTSIHMHFISQRSLNMNTRACVETNIYIYVRIYIHIYVYTYNYAHDTISLTINVCVYTYHLTATECIYG